MLNGGVVDRSTVRRQAAFLDGLFGVGIAAGVLAGLDDRAVDDGHPIWFDDGTPLEDLNEFLRGPYTRATAAAYAGDIAHLGRFLHARGKTLRDCTGTDAEDFKRARQRQVGPARWARQGTAISVYYRWLVATARIDRSPIQPWPDANGRNRFAPHRRRQRLVPFLGADDYRWFRNRCLATVGDPIREPLFSDLGVESGARRSELNRLSWIGLPDRHPGRNPCEIWIVGKGSKQRQVFVSWATLQKVLAYRLGPRAEAVETAQAHLEHQLGAGQLTLCEIRPTDRYGRPQVQAKGERSRPLVDVADDTLARLVVRRHDGQLDPATLFVSARGAHMLDPSHWNRMFSAANTTAQRLNDTFPRVTPHVLRHTFAVQLFSALLHRLRARSATPTEQVLEEPRLFIARILGHADPSTTLVYLEAAMRSSGEPLNALAEMCELFADDCEPP